MDYKDKTDCLCDLFNQMVNQYGKLEKGLHTYGTDIPLHLSDTHTIVAIGKNTDINITNLAKLQGISRSAVSQMISKLVKRGLVTKETSPETDNEVVLSLTEAGEVIFRTHEKQHDLLHMKLASVFAKYPENIIFAQLQINS